MAYQTKGQDVGSLDLLSTKGLGAHASMVILFQCGEKSFMGSHIPDFDISLISLFY